MNKRIKKKRIRMENKKLCKRYPFLIPRDWADRVIWESKWNRKDEIFHIHPYSYTELDFMPIGWRKKFGIQMCEEIREELIKHNYLNEYRIFDIKEKCGELRWYDCGTPVDSKVEDIIEKYSELSTHICRCCGRAAEVINNCGWYEPICEPCRLREEKEREEKYQKYQKWKRKGRTY